MHTRMNRRIYGLLSKRLDEVGFDEVPDGRDSRGKRWKLGALLRCTVAGMLAGACSVAAVETLSTRLSRPLRRLLGVHRRVPDTTLRQALCRLDPSALRKPLHALIHRAHRRQALESAELPFGIVSLDGKHTSLPSCDDWYAQRQTSGDENKLVGVVRTVTATLTSSPARPIIDVVAIPACTNEMGHFGAALHQLCEAYAGSGLFELVTYDAGACSAHNATLVRQHGLHYLFCLTAGQPTLLADAQLWLGPRALDTADATSVDLERGRRVVRRLYLGEVTVALDGWQHLRTVIRVEKEFFDATGKSLGKEDRYLLSSLPGCRLTAAHWLLVIRQRWGVETSHQILDTAFVEDDHPWIESEPRAALVVAVLRRIAYTLLTLFRSVTQRSDERRAVPWKTLMGEVSFALIMTTNEQVSGLRRHHRVPLRC